MVTLASEQRNPRAQPSVIVDVHSHRNTQQFGQASDFRSVAEQVVDLHAPRLFGS
jgi:hypothetical protein